MIPNSENVSPLRGSRINLMSTQGFRPGLSSLSPLRGLASGPAFSSGGCHSTLTSFFSFSVSLRAMSPGGPSSISVFFVFCGTYSFWMFN